jgi:GNAT superfamily N-acetyltransferase
MTFVITEGYIPGCIGRIVQLHAAYYSHVASFGVAFESKVATELAEFCTRYQPGRDGLWLARSPEVEASIVIDGSKSDTEGAHLRWFIASEATRGRGVGRALLTHAMNLVDCRGYKLTYLWTFSGLGAARHLYENFGFRLDHESPGSQWGKEVLEQRFIRGKA